MKRMYNYRNGNGLYTGALVNDHDARDGDARITLLNGSEENATRADNYTIMSLQAKLTERRKLVTNEGKDPKKDHLLNFMTHIFNKATDQYAAALEKKTTQEKQAPKPRATGIKKSPFVVDRNI